MPGGTHLRNKALDFLFQCLSLGTPLARVITFGIGISLLTFVDVSMLGLPNFCIWERIFGFCPAKGTTRALNAFFHGEFKKALEYNLNILVIIPTIISILFVDVLRVIKARRFFKNSSNRN